jgi:hypothetical protein
VKVLRSLLPNRMLSAILKDLLEVCSPPEMGMDILLPVSQFLPDCRRSFLERSMRRLILVRDGEADRPLIVVIVEFFDRRTVCAGVDSNISRSSRAESTVERGVEGRRVLGSCQAGEAGYSEE